MAIVVDKRTNKRMAVSIAPAVILIPEETGLPSVINPQDMPFLVMEEGSPEEVEIWTMAEGKVDGQVQNPRELKISQLPLISDFLDRTYRNTDPEDYIDRVSLTELVRKALASH